MRGNERTKLRVIKQLQRQATLRKAKKDQRKERMKKTLRRCCD